MPGACGYSWAAFLDDLLKQKADQYNVPRDFVYGTVAVESAFDPWACGDHVGGGSIITGADGHLGMVILDPASPIGFYVAWECGRSPGVFGFSHGLLQLHTGGGQGSGMLWSQLVDPAQNLDRGLPSMAYAIDLCNDAAMTFHDVVCCFARYSGHPGWVDCSDARVYALENAINCFAREFAGLDPISFLHFLGCPLSLVLLPFILPLAAVRGRRGARRRLLDPAVSPPRSPSRKDGG